jgi:hypothetical protein
MALLIKLVSVALLGLIHRIYYRGGKLFGFKQLQVVNHSVLPSINSVGSMIHAIYYIMALSMIEKHRPIRSHGRETAHSVWKCMSDVVLNGIEMVY